MAPEQDDPTRTVRDHLGVLRRRGWIVALIAALGVAATFGWSARQPERYQATTLVLVQQERPTVVDPAADQQVETRRLDPLRVMQNEVRRASSDLVRSRVTDSVGGPVTGSVTNPRDTDVVSIVATGATATRAAELADAWAAAYLAVRADDAAGRTAVSAEQSTRAIEGIDARLSGIDDEMGGATGERRAVLEAERAVLIDQRAGWEQQRRVIEANAVLADDTSAVVIDGAEVPTTPFQPATARNLALGLLVGLAVGLVAAYTVDALDDRIRRPDDLRRLLHLPALGSTRPGATDEVMVAGLDAPELAGAELDRAIASASAPSGARVLLIPTGTAARAAGSQIEALRRLGVTAVGALLVPPPPDASAPDPRGDAPADRSAAAVAAPGRLGS
jgi:capsular polysaccharide biosynthesis protein